jgi:hypothetical protein
MNRFLTVLGFVAFASASIFAQAPQIPTLQVCNLSSGMVVAGGGTVFIAARATGGFLGDFSVKVSLSCDANGYPTGSLVIAGINMNDSTVQGNVIATTFEQLTSTGKVTPTAYLNGRCDYTDVTGAVARGGHYWIMFAHNNTAPTATAGTPDVVSFLVFDKTGKRIAYGTGPLRTGSIVVSPTSN